MKHHIVSKSPIPDSKIFVIKELHAPHFDPVFHFHQEYQLFLVIKGEGVRFVGDNIKTFKKGDLVLIGPNLPHVWRNDNAYFDKNNNLGTIGIVIYFQDHFLRAAIHQKEELENIHHVLQKCVRGLEITGDSNRVVSKMMIKMLELKGFDGLVQLLKILDVIAKSTECHFINHNHDVSINTQYTHAETDRMNRVYEYVMKNFKGKISLESVAIIANMTPTSFSRYFKSRVNKSFSNFLKEIRIDFACKLLNGEKMNIEQVGYECGFHTLSNFNKQFKRVTGKQPIRYRSEYLKVKIDTYGDF